MELLVFVACGVLGGRGGGGLEGIATYACQSRVWDLGAHRHDEQDPGLWILHCLPCLVSLEVVVFYSLPVSRYR
jgi:hypothetical protein